MRAVSLLPILAVIVSVSAAPAGDKPQTWKNTPDNKKFQVQGNMQPVAGQSDPHITFRKGKDDMTVTNYQGWKENPRTGQMSDAGRWRGEGKSHGGINPPIYYPAEPGQKKQPARAATFAEAPTPKKGSKDDSKVGARPAAPKRTKTMRRDLLEELVARDLLDLDELVKRAGEKPQTWKNTPDNKKFQVQGNMQPVAGQSDPHITFRKGKDDMTVTNYQGWKENPRTGQMSDAGRWRGEGKSHGGISPPIYYPAEPGQKKQPARAATFAEAPTPKKGSKDDSKVGARPAAPKRTKTMRRELVEMIERALELEERDFEDEAEEWL